MMSVYKSGQGRYTRMFTVMGGAVIVAIGCFRLFQTLDAGDVSLWVSTMVPVGMFIGLSVLIMWLMNKPNIANFMIAAEGEM